MTANNKCPVTDNHRMVPNPFWGLRPIRAEDGTVQIREVYYNANGSIILIEDSYAWPYDGDQTKNINLLSEIYSLPLKDIDTYYKCEIIECNQPRAKPNFMTNEQWAMQLEEEAAAEKAAKIEDDTALAEEAVEEE